ncbi:IS982 family transposase [Ktedonosporobacter rubrisoli]|uniref:IS982 family transposase n=1 Tax=Ktedonosporobacter rubrisoli TaxID=2509675 RepID=A0A4P6JKV1_KTERU|nr:IS982 family transposase [Ktedonosporobacter rubrisoli]QBD75808.1 IS982 family transposase [Ktedonosporobacter rubrisoli]
MNLDDFIITCFYWIDEMMPSILEGRRLRRRGPQPKLTDSEVLTMEVVGTYLGLNQEKRLLNFFRQHYRHFFPALHQLHRSTFVRQAANLWAVKERMWCWVRDELVRHDPLVGIVESVPVPVCRFARAPWCVRFRGSASYGKDHADRQTFYGFRLHLRLGWPGVITHGFLAPANEPDGEIAPLVLQGTQGIVLGDRGSWLPDLQAELREQGLLLQAPYRRAHAPLAAAFHSPVLGRVRYLIDTVFGQLTDRCQLKRVWARDCWHLRNRLLRLFLMHTLCVWFNQQDDLPRLLLDRFVA